MRFFKFLFPIFLLSAIQLSGQINASVTSGCAPLTEVQFSSPVAGTWDFGDGSSAIGVMTPKHTFSNPGTYDVIFNNGGTPDTIEIQVFGKPSPDFYTLGAQEGCIPFVVDFRDTSEGSGSGNIVQWEWAFGDGGSSTQQHPTYTYSLVGNFTVSLIVTDQNGCDSTIVFPQYIKTVNSPVSNFAFDDYNECTAPHTVNISNNSTNSTGGTTGLTYEWDFGDGTTSTNGSLASHTYTSEGSYTATLTVTEAGGCSRTSTKTVNIGAPQAIINMPDTICINQLTNLTNGSVGGTSWRWEVDGNFVSNQLNATYIFTTPGFHDVFLRATASGCQTDTTIQVYVQELTADFDINPSFLCGEPFCMQFTDNSGPDAVSWFYDFDNGATSVDQNPNYCYPLGGDEYTVYNPAGYYFEVELEIMSKWGCRASVIKRDTIFPPAANFAPDSTQGCAPMLVTFEDSSRGDNIVSYEYLFHDGTTSFGDQATYNYTDPGQYEVRLAIEDENGCRDTSFAIVIQVGENIALDANFAPTSVCIGDTITFTDISGNDSIDYWHYETDGNRATDCPENQNQQHAFYDETGFHDVTFYADFNGCISSRTFANAVEVLGPSAKIRWTGNCTTPTQINFDADISGVDEFIWDFGDGTVLPQTANLNDTAVSHTYAASGDYWAKFIAINNSSGCVNDTDSILVKIRQVEAVITGDSVFCADAPFLLYSQNSVDEGSFCTDQYQWSLGPNTPIYTTDDTSFVFEFPDTGRYTVQLMVRDINGCKDTTQLDVVVGDIKAGFFPSDSTGCIPLAINFTDTSSSDTLIYRWFWDFGDGTLDSNQNPTHTYTNAYDNSHTVRLIVVDTTGCRDTTMMDIEPIIPDSNWTVSDRTICAGDSVTFNPSNPGATATFNWTFDNKGTSTESNPKFAFDTAGVYTVTLDRIDTNGCPSSRTRTAYIDVEDYPIVGFESNFDNASVICWDEQITFTDTSTAIGFGGRVWNLGTGSPVLPNTSVSWNFDAPGIYPISLVVWTSNGCRDTIVKPLEIVGPISDINLNQSLICVGDSIVFDLVDSSSVATWLWDFGDGTSESGVAPVTHTFSEVPNGGTTNVQLIVWSLDSVCDATASTTVNIHQVEARFDLVDSTVCDYLTVDVTNNSIGNTSNLWDFGNGTNSTLNTPGGQSYSSPGFYTITLEVTNPTNGCVDTMSRVVEILARPDVTTSPRSMCEGDSAQLVAVILGGGTYSWTPASLASAPNNATTWVFPDETTDFVVTGTDTNGCENTATASVLVFVEPTPIYFDTCVIVGEPFSIGQDYGDQYIYDWNNGATVHLICLDCPEQEITVYEKLPETVYIEEFTDTAGCFVTQNEYTICVEESYTIDVPSAFTPNGDNINSIIYARGHGIDELIYFQIYNRWGELVFETNDINQGWDGNYKGEAQNMETYIWKAKVKFYNGTYKEAGGSITLIR